MENIVMDFSCIWICLENNAFKLKAFKFAFLIFPYLNLEKHVIQLEQIQ